MIFMNDIMNDLWMIFKGDILIQYVFLNVIIDF